MNPRWNADQQAPGERGQALFLLVGVFTVFLVIAAIVIDFGLWFSERRGVQQAADFAALAGLQDLPSDGSGAAEMNARDWAEKNGYPDGVTVELLCKNTLSLCINTNPPGTGPSGNCLTGCDALRVTISKPVPRLFTALPFFGIGEVRAEASAVAGIGGVGGGAGGGSTAGATTLLFDASGTMLNACNNTRSNDGCAIKEALAAAHGFVDVAIDGGAGAVGFVPYNYCYRPPAPLSSILCVPEANVVAPTTNGADLHAAINATTARSLTNACLPLLRAVQIFEGGAGAGGGALVLLSDGDNNAFFGQEWRLIPATCRPSFSNAVDFAFGCRGLPPFQQELEVDVKAWQMANQLKDQGIEIYVVGLRVCGADDGRTSADAGYCSGIGDDAHDNVADQRLLKCIASSPDHYFNVPLAQGLPAAFQEIAVGLVGGGLLQ